MVPASGRGRGVAPQGPASRAARSAYAEAMTSPGGSARPAPAGDDWTALLDGPLPVAEALAWAVVPRCGGVVTFTGTVRDHADDRGRRRDGVTGLEYEAYSGPAKARLEALAAEARRRFPGIGRVALLHRVGHLVLGETAVVVVVSAPHRDEAFDAARWAIDTLKATVPIWKKEEWAGGNAWGTGALPVDEVPVDEVPVDKAPAADVPAERRRTAEAPA